MILELLASRPIQTHFNLFASYKSLVISESDCILHGYIKKLGGPFASAWQTRYAKLYPNRLELHLENSAKPEMILLDTVEEVSSDLVSVKGEQCIVLRARHDTKVVLTNAVCDFVWFLKNLSHILCWFCPGTWKDGSKRFIFLGIPAVVGSRLTGKVIVENDQGSAYIN